MSGRGRRGGFRGRGRHGRGPSRLAQRVCTLELHQRLNETGKWPKKLACITMKPHQVDPKIYQTVRLQSTAGVASWEPEISTIMGLVEPTFQKFHLVSFSIYS